MGWKALFGGGAAFHKLFRTAPGETPSVASERSPPLPQSEVGAAHAMVENQKSLNSFVL
jgi:hypothetical protein